MPWYGWAALGTLVLCFALFWLAVVYAIAQRKRKVEEHWRKKWHWGGDNGTEE